MVRTVISLDERDKRWLDETAEREGTSMTELVRRAIRHYRDQAKGPMFEELLEATAGTWTEGDGLSWQRRLREEWDDRPA